jgi:hypothetical protein
VPVRVHRAQVGRQARGQRLERDLLVGPVEQALAQLLGDRVADVGEDVALLDRPGERLDQPLQVLAGELGSGDC